MSKTRRKIEIYWLHEKNPNDLRIVLTTSSKLYKGWYMRCYGVVCGKDREYVHQSKWHYYPLKAEENSGFTYIGKL
jgi:hypothetical protein